MSTSAADPSPLHAQEFWVSTRRGCVILLYVISAYSGAVQIVSGDNFAIQLASSLMFASTATCWAIADARIAGRQFMHIGRLLFFFTWPVAFLVYLALTRGWRGCRLYLLHGIGLIVAMCSTFYPAYILLALA